MTQRLMAAAGIACAVTATAAAVESLALLPIQDRVGAPATADRVRGILVMRLDDAFRLVDADDVRDAMREHRVRDPANATPALVAELAQSLGADRVLAVTLHEADDTRVPTIALAGHAFGRDERELFWAGFESATGLSTRSVLGLGEIETLERLTVRVADRLAVDLLASVGHGRHRRSARRVNGARDGFLARPLTPADLGRVAVVPFEGISDVGAGDAAAMLTDVALATLSRRGVALARPDLVNETLRRRGALHRDALDPLSRAALGIAAGADHVFTGTAEIFALVGGGLEPEPHVAVAARLFDVSSGRLLWMNGVEEMGWNHEGLFQTQRVYARGALADLIMESMVAGLLVEGQDDPIEADK